MFTHFVVVNVTILGKLAGIERQMGFAFVSRNQVAVFVHPNTLKLFMTGVFTQQNVVVYPLVKADITGRAHSQRCVVVEGFHAEQPFR